MNPRRYLPSVRARHGFVLRAVAEAAPQRLLEVGCGEGDLLRALALPGREVCACDVNAEDVAHAQRVAGSAVACVVVPEARLPWEDGRFDVVVCADVIEHVADPVALLRELRRVVREAGVVVLTAPNRAFPWTYDPVNALRSRPVAGLGAYAYGHTHLPDAATIAAWSAEAGLAVRRSEGLVHGIAAPVEAYWAGAAQALWKANRHNRSGSRRGWRFDDREPPFTRLVDGLLALDARLGRGGRSVGMGFVLEADRPRDHAPP